MGDLVSRFRVIFPPVGVLPHQLFVFRLSQRIVETRLRCLPCSFSRGYAAAFGLAGGAALDDSHHTRCKQREPDQYRKGQDAVEQTSSYASATASNSASRRSRDRRAVERIDRGRFLRRLCHLGCLRRRKGRVARKFFHVGSPDQRPIGRSRGRNPAGYHPYRVATETS